MIQQMHDCRCRSRSGRECYSIFCMFSSSNSTFKCTTGRIALYTKKGEIKLYIMLKFHGTNICKVCGSNQLLQGEKRNGQSIVYCTFFLKSKESRQRTCTTIFISNPKTIWIIWCHCLSRLSGSRYCGCRRPRIPRTRLRQCPDRSDR